MYPIIFTPDYKERVWGGQKLKTVLNKNIPFENTGESWEVACHNNGQSRVKNGQYAGYTLDKLLQEKGMEILGVPFNKGDKFPLLIKFIDAKEKLSVQVHPDDHYASEFENGELGKSEAWYILQADKGAKLVAGLKDGVTKEEFRKKLMSGNLEEILNEVEVKAGDVLNIPAGLIHAIGDGILLAEIQQNSDTTYRVYDWGRLGLDGNPRELHIEKSIDVIDFEHKHSKKLVNPIVFSHEGYRVSDFVRNEYFVLQEVVITRSYLSESRKHGFEIYMCVNGSGIIRYKDGSKEKEVDIAFGETCLLPASLQAYSIHPKEDKVIFVKGFVE